MYYMKDSQQKNATTVISILLNAGSKTFPCNVLTSPVLYPTNHAGEPQTATLRVCEMWVNT